MDISLYYQILDIGIVYEKGGQRGKRWRISERKRLKEVMIFWRKIIGDISQEKEGSINGEWVFDSLENLCKKYKFPNYERILERKEELINCTVKFERKEQEEASLRGFMEALLSDAERNLEGRGGKDAVYRLLSILHNLPKAMHGKNILNPNFSPISYQDALRYAEGYMDEKMKKEYERYLL